MKKTSLKEKKASVEVLYKNIFSIKESLQDAISVAQETSNIASEFGGEISRVITSQINDYLVPVISKYIEDNATPGAVAPLITFLDSVPLSMTREEPTPDVVAPSPIDTTGSQRIQAPPTLEGAAVQTESKKNLDSYIKSLDEGFKINNDTRLVISPAKEGKVPTYTISPVDPRGPSILFDEFAVQELETMLGIDLIENVNTSGIDLEFKMDTKEWNKIKSSRLMSEKKKIKEEEESLLSDDNVKELSDEWGVTVEEVRDALTKATAETDIKSQ